MRLSEAIRLGAMLHPQCFGALKIEAIGPDGVLLHTIATCAIGAAHEAGYPVSVVDVEWTTCPACFQQWAFSACIAHLNDDHKWTRERIADQVEQWEQAREQRDTGSSESATKADAVDPCAHVVEG